MRKLVMISATAAALVLGSAGAAFAHSAPPCNTGDPLDPTPVSGQNYAQHHIVPLATIGGLGADGHVPGSHRGFSACDPSGL